MRRIVKNMKNPVTILNMHFTGLGIARNLAGLNIPVYGLSHRREFPGNYSRYCKFQLCPDSSKEPEKLLQFLIDFAKEIQLKSIIFPTRDHDVVFLDKFRSYLEEYFILPLPDSHILDQVLNKDKLRESASSIGLITPKSLQIKNLNDYLKERNNIPIPCVIKPQYSHLWRMDKIWEIAGEQKVAKFDDLSGLDDFYKRLSDSDGRVIIQEFIPGPEENLVMFCSFSDKEGNVINYFTGRKLLQYPSLYGTGIVVEGRLIPDIVDFSKRLIKKLTYYGICEIEYKRHSESGEYYLIEINARHWDQHILGTHMGVNLTKSFYNQIINGKVENETQVGVPLTWISEGDFIRIFFSNLIKKKYSSRYLISLIRGKKIFSIWSRDDIRPAIKLIISISKDISKALIAKLKFFNQKFKSNKSNKEFNSEKKS